MKVKRLSNDIDIKTYLKKLGTDKGGIDILSSKHKHYLFYIKDMHVGAANILKQDALSIGADLAVPDGVIVAKEKIVDGILIATKKHIKILSQKEKAQPFGLKDLALKLSEFLKEKEFDIKIMGVINANDDSFFEGSRFKGKDAVFKIEKMIADGADIIDIGAVSSRPGAEYVGEEEELKRIKPIVDEIYKTKLFEKTVFSIDSYSPKVVSYVLDRGFGIVNDITGLRDDEICKLCASYNATAVIMHMQNDPKTMQNNPTYDDVILDIEEFFKERLEKAKAFGIDDIVLDVGIGFGKTLEHNLELIKHLGHFKKFRLPLLLGASRKSMIDKIFPSDVKKRLPGTLTLHLKALDEGASILRVHDVYEHKQAVEIYKALKDV